MRSHLAGTRWRGIAPRLLLAAVTIAITLTAAEAIARRFSPRLMMVPWPDDLHGITVLPMAVTGRLTIPGQFDTTITVHDRFRSRRPIAREAAPGVVRIAMLGDSSTFGFGSEDDETYPEALERTLNARSDPASLPRVEVLNAGVPGTGTGEQALFYDYWVRQFQPAVVVLTVYWNDVDDDALSSCFEFAAGDGSVQPRPPEVLDRAADSLRRARAISRSIPGLAWLSAHSELIAWIRQAPRALLVRSHLRAISGDAGDLQRPETLPPDQLARFRGEIRWLRERVAPARLVLAFLPSANIFDARRTEHARTVSRSDQIRAALRAAASEDGLPFMDGLPAMAEQPDVSRLYFTGDSHPNPAGNRVFAEALALFLIRERIVAGAGERRLGASGFDPLIERAHIRLAAGTSQLTVNTVQHSLAQVRLQRPGPAQIEAVHFVKRPQFGSRPLAQRRRGLKYRANSRSRAFWSPELARSTS